jgi:uncharacterized protein
MKIKHLTRPLEVKEVRENGTFEGYGSVFNVIDSYRDIVLPGAFKQSLDDHSAKGSSPALLWQHDHKEPIGVWESMEEDDHGLKMTGRLAISTQKGREAYELLKMGAVKGLSIGFSIPKGGEEFDEMRSVNLIKNVALWETSIVTFPANQESQVTGVRASLSDGTYPDVREFETFLMHDAGFSRKQARIILNDGYKALLTQDADEETAELLKSLQKLKGNI